MVLKLKGAIFEFIASGYVGIVWGLVFIVLLDAAVLGGLNVCRIKGNFIDVRTTLRQTFKTRETNEIVFKSE